MAMNEDFKNKIKSKIAQELPSKSPTEFNTGEYGNIASTFLTPASKSEMEKRKQGAKGIMGTTSGDSSGTGVNSLTADSSSSPPTDNTYNLTRSPSPASITQTIGNTDYKTFQPEQVRSGIGNSNDTFPTSLQNTSGVKTTLNINDGIGGTGTIVSDRTLSPSQIDSLGKTVAFNAANPKQQNTTTSQYPDLGKREELVNKLNAAISGDNQREQAIYMKLLQNFDDNATARIGQQVTANTAQTKTDFAENVLKAKFNQRDQQQQEALQNDTLKQLSSEFTKNPIFSPGQAGAIYKSRIGQNPDANTVRNLISMSGKENMDKFNSLVNSGDKIAIGKYLLEDSAFEPETVANFLDSLK